MQDELTERLGAVFAAMFGSLLIGTVGYIAIEGWHWFDALYMTVITLGTIGYGETHPLSTSGRAFTIGLCLLGLGAMAYSFSSLTAFIVEGELNETLRRRKMDKRIHALTEHYVVCGMGNTGETIVAELTNTRQPFTIVEKDEEKAKRLVEKGFLVVQGDALHDDILDRAGIERAKGLFLTLDNDRDNVFIALTARGVNPSIRIISVVHEGAVKNKLIRSGADAVVSTPMIGGLRMASEMIRPAAVGFLDAMIRAKDSAYRFEQIDIAESSPYAGKTIESLASEGGASALVLAVRGSNSEEFSVNPPKNRILNPGEQIVALGNQDEISALRETVKG